MRQVFRLMDMPDKVIAFDELPPEMLDGLELSDCSKLPKDWREFIGFRERTIPILPDRDPFTGLMRKYDPIKERAPYAYIIDREVNHDRERWSEIESYVHRNAPKEFRLKDKISEMALPMARDVHSELSLEVDEVITIPLGEKAQMPAPALIVQPVIAAKTEAPIIEEVPVKAAPIKPVFTIKEKGLLPQAPICPACDKEFSSRQALRMHITKKHPEPQAAPTGEK